MISQEAKTNSTTCERVGAGGGTDEDEKWKEWIEGRMDSELYNS